MGWAITPDISCRSRATVSPSTGDGFGESYGLAPVTYFRDSLFSASASARALIHACRSESLSNWLVKYGARPSATAASQATQLGSKSTGRPKNVPSGPVVGSDFMTGERVPSAVPAKVRPSTSAPHWPIRVFRVRDVAAHAR